MEAARKMLDRLYGALRGIEIPEQVRAQAQPDAAVLASLEDDLNTPKALAGLFHIARELNRTSDDAERISLAATLLASSELLGIAQGDVEAWFSGAATGELSGDDIEALIEKRNAARAAKDFAAADAVRDQLAAAGVTIEDGANGTRWRRSG